jgi:hypothetical protein
MIQKLKEWLERLFAPKKPAPAPVPVRNRR